MALGVASIVAVLVIHGVVAQSFTRNAAGYDMIVTTKQGKPRSGVEHRVPSGESGRAAAVHVLRRILEDAGETRKVRQIRLRGDSRIAWGITTKVSASSVRRPKCSTSWNTCRASATCSAAGKNYKQDDYLGAVVGSLVARRTGLVVGGKFSPTHGVTENEDAHVHDPFIISAGSWNPRARRTIAPCS